MINGGMDLLTWGKIVMVYHYEGVMIFRHDMKILCQADKVTVWGHLGW